MVTFRGMACREVEVGVGGRVYTLLVPERPEGLLEDPRVQQRFEADEYLPYWADLWPAAIILAERVAQWEPPPGGAKRVLEIGCGIGLAGLVASARGYDVVLSDYDADAVAFARENAIRNGLERVEARQVDWRAVYPELVCGRILAADVLYERRNLEPVAHFLGVHLTGGGEALIADADRQTADGFPAVAARHGLRVEVEAFPSERRFEGVRLAGRVFRAMKR